MDDKEKGQAIIKVASIIKNIFREIEINVDAEMIARKIIEDILNDYNMEKKN